MDRLGLFQADGTDIDWTSPSAEDHMGHVDFFAPSDGLKALFKVRPTSLTRVCASCTTLTCRAAVMSPACPPNGYLPHTSTSARTPSCLRIHPPIFYRTRARNPCPVLQPTR